MKRFVDFFLRIVTFGTLFYSTIYILLYTYLSNKHEVIWLLLEKPHASHCYNKMN